MYDFENLKKIEKIVTQALIITVLYFPNIRGLS